MRKSTFFFINHYSFKLTLHPAKVRKLNDKVQPYKQFHRTICQKTLISIHVPGRTTFSHKYFYSISLKYIISPYEYANYSGQVYNIRAIFRYIYLPPPGRNISLLFNTCSQCLYLHLYYFFRRPHLHVQALLINNENFN